MVKINNGLLGFCIILLLIFFSINVSSQVGIATVSGKPLVTCPTSIDTESASITPLNAKVKNIGEQSGAFSLSATCEEGVRISVPTSNIVVSSGEEKILKFTVTGSSEETITRECTIKATDMRGGGSDSCKFEVNLQGFRVDVLPKEFEQETGNGTNFMVVFWIIIALILAVVLWRILKKKESQGNRRKK